MDKYQVPPHTDKGEDHASHPNPESRLRGWPQASLVARGIKNPSVGAGPDPCFGETPQVSEQLSPRGPRLLSLCSGAHMHFLEPVLLEKRTHSNEKPPHHD